MSGQILFQFLCRLFVQKTIIIIFKMVVFENKFCWFWYKLFINFQWSLTGCLSIQQDRTSSPYACIILVYKLIAPKVAKITFSLFTLEQHSKKSMLSLTQPLTFKMNGLRILSKRSIKGRVEHIRPATIVRSLRSLGSKTSTYFV